MQNWSKKREDTSAQTKRFNYRSKNRSPLRRTVYAKYRVSTLFAVHSSLSPHLSSYWGTPCARNSSTYRCQQKVEITNCNLFKFCCVFGFHKMMPCFFHVTHAVEDFNATRMIQFVHSIAWIVCTEAATVKRYPIDRFSFRMRRTKAQARERLPSSSSVGVYFPNSVK